MRVFELIARKMEGHITLTKMAVKSFLFPSHILRASILNMLSEYTMPNDEVSEAVFTNGTTLCTDVWVPRRRRIVLVSRGDPRVV